VYRSRHQTAPAFDTIVCGLKHSAMHADSAVWCQLSECLLSVVLRLVCLLHRMRRYTHRLHMHGAQQCSLLAPIVLIGHLQPATRATIPTAVIQSLWCTKQRVSPLVIRMAMVACWKRLLVCAFLVSGVVSIARSVHR